MSTGLRCYGSGSPNLRPLIQLEQFTKKRRGKLKHSRSQPQLSPSKFGESAVLFPSRLPPVEGGSDEDNESVSTIKSLASSIRSMGTHGTLPTLQISRTLSKDVANEQNIEDLFLWGNCYVSMKPLSPSNSNYVSRSSSPASPGSRYNMSKGSKSLRDVRGRNRSRDRLSPLSPADRRYKLGTGHGHNDDHSMASTISTTDNDGDASCDDANADLYADESTSRSSSLAHQELVHQESQIITGNEKLETTPENYVIQLTSFRQAVPARASNPLESSSEKLRSHINVKVMQCVLQALYYPRLSPKSITIRVLGSGKAAPVKAERVVSVEEAKTVVHLTADLDLSDVDHIAIIDKFASDPMKHVDLGALRSAVLKIFKESDDDGNNYLTVDEFMIQLRQFDMRFTKLIGRLANSEISELIAEVDSDDGVIQYHEFVHFAVELVLAFRARNIARRAVEEYLAGIDAEVRGLMKAQDVKELVKSCLASFKELDMAGTGLLKVADFQKVISRVSGKGMINELEMSSVRKQVVRDSFGKIVYASFPEVFEKARYLSLKRELLERQGSAMEKALLAECKVAEEKFYVPQSLRSLIRPSPYLHSGHMHFRDVTNILTSSPNITLTHLQTNIILSAVDIDVDNNVDYYQLIPLLARFMSELALPENAKQRDSMARAAGLVVDVDDENKEYTIDDISDLANLLVGRVRLKPSRKELGGIDIVLPADHTVLLAVREDVDLPAAMSTDEVHSCTVKALSSPYDSDSIIFRATNVNYRSNKGSMRDVTEFNFSPASKAVLSMGDHEDHVICERSLEIERVVASLSQDNENFISELRGVVGFDKQMEHLAQVAVAKIRMGFLLGTDDPNQSKDIALQEKLRGEFMTAMVLLPGEEDGDVRPTLKREQSTKSASMEPDVLADGAHMELFRNYAILPISVIPLSKAAVAKAKKRRITMINSSNSSHPSFDRRMETPPRSVGGILNHALHASRSGAGTGTGNTAPADDDTSLYSRLIKHLSAKLDESGVDPPEIRAVPALVCARIAPLQKTVTGVTLSSARELLISAIAVDCSYSFSAIPVPVTFPSHAMFDNKAAMEYVSSLISKLYLEVPHDWHGETSTIKLHIK